MTLLLAFLAGVLTLINPCVLPVVPIVLASALQAHRLGPLALIGGMAASFVALGLLVTAAGPALGLRPETVPQIAAWAMLGFGLILMVPGLNAGFSRLAAPLAAGAEGGLSQLAPSGLSGQGATGVLLGAVWSPCVGPTLGGALALAASGHDLGRAAAVMTAFALGLGAVMAALAYGARATLARRRDGLRRLAPWAKPVMGVVLAATGLAILTGLDHRIEGWAIQTLPASVQDLSVVF